MIRNKAENVHADRCGNTSEQKCHTNGNRKEAKLRQFLYRNTTNVEHEMCGYTGSNWSKRNSNKRLKVKIWKLYQENIR